MSTKYFLFFTLKFLTFSILSSLFLSCQTNSKSQKTEQFGVSAYKLSNSTRERQFFQNQDKLLPMASIYKFPLALTIMKQVDQNRLRLSQIYTISPQELTPNTWSPLRDKFPNGGNFSLEELLNYSLISSDNIATDKLFSIIGGPNAVQKQLRNWNIKNVFVVDTEAQLHKNPNLQYRNSATAEGLSNLICSFYKGKLLNKNSRRWLLNTMSQCQTGKNRLLAGFPPNTRWIHKTGTGSTINELCVATNDAGIAILPNGETWVISALLSDSSRPEMQREKALADMAKLILSISNIKLPSNSYQAQNLNKSL